MSSKLISQLEQAVMEVLWKKPEVSVREVQDLMKKKHNLAYTTVATLLQRLFTKGMVEKKSKGRAFVFIPALSKESYSKRLAHSFMSSFFTSYGDIALVSFAEAVDTLPQQKRKQLLDLLESHDE